MWALTGAFIISFPMTSCFFALVLCLVFTSSVSLFFLVLSAFSSSFLLHDIHSHVQTDLEQCTMLMSRELAVDYGL